MTMEVRSVALFVEPDKFDLRVERAEGKAPVLRGYAIPFNSLSKDLGGFRERILPGAVSATLESGADIRGLIDHDPSKLIGRTSAGTLRVGQDNRGLWFNIDLPDTTYARDYEKLIDRGDVRGMSFGFIVPKGGDRFVKEGDQVIREVSAMDLKEITVTSIPAYGDTSLHLRTDPGIGERIAAEFKPAPPPPPPAPRAVDFAARRLAATE
jgi:HK97 family phage prohead protease